jgi:hypothetical protein
VRERPFCDPPTARAYGTRNGGDCPLSTRGGASFPLRRDGKDAHSSAGAGARCDKRWGAEDAPGSCCLEASGLEVLLAMAGRGLGGWADQGRLTTVGYPLAMRANAAEPVWVETGRKVFAILASYMVREGLLVT